MLDRFMRRAGNPTHVAALEHPRTVQRRTALGFGKGALLWLLGIPLPIILLLALFWR
jgi:hypothetical protein